MSGAGDSAFARAYAESLPEGFLRVNTTAWIGPVSSQLIQESDLLLAPRQVAVHPESGMAERSRAFLATELGKVPVQVVHDPALPPGQVLSENALAASLGTQRGGGGQVTCKHRGKTRTVYVPRDLKDEVEAWVQEHRRLKRLLKKITALQLELIRLHRRHKARRGGRV